MRLRVNKLSLGRRWLAIKVPSVFLLAVIVCEKWVLEGLLSCYPARRVLLQASSDKVDKLGVFLHPVLLKVRYSLGEHGHI